MSSDARSGLKGMIKLRVHITVSADGYVAGPNQSLENPLGEGGGSLHEWAFAPRAFREPHGLEGGEVNASTPVVEESLANVGAEIMAAGRSAVNRGTGATIRGRGGGARSRRSTCPCSFSLARRYR
jgi:hypothetical protein